MHGQPRERDIDAIPGSLADLRAAVAGTQLCAALPPAHRRPPPRRTQAALPRIWPYGRVF
jgi:hypothetical protein